MQAKERKLGIWERYLTLWVVLCIVAGTLVGRAFPIVSELLTRLEVAHISIPIAICLFAMIYPIMVQISFGEVKKAVRSPRPILLTLIMNWGIKPFTMALFAWLFLRVVFSQFLDPAQVYQYRAGLILLGVAPCTAMVLMWSYLARGNMAHTLVMTAINSLSMVILFAPLATFLLGISGISVPWKTIALAVIIYICTPLVAGWITRKLAIRSKGREWFEKKLIPPLGKTAIIALLITLVVLFTYQGEKIIRLPALIGMITAAIFVNILLIFGVSYLLAKVLRLGYQDAAPTAIIAGSNHFEVAIAVATTLFGVTSGAALATVVGVLTEVPIMLFLVWLCKRTRGFFSSSTSA
ncbi:ACR3 family arsenite efflux transporter [Candidatus Aerophobetes bacterium]|uniref:ACR3 family arsenite efflux transporter n=1 Tax=Aerophobetes bacterium TaxID=2030807 RepID=A0A523W341_UNCAE|nr:MAG: ACR3 family arsenite efflux transporter [Candidatus Aerophobetes bacterium]